MKTKEEKDVLEYLKGKGYANQAQQTPLFMVKDHLIEYTQSLREQLKEKEEEISIWKLTAHDYLRRINRLEEDISPTVDEALKQLQSQSTLIESLAGALKESRDCHENSRELSGDEITFSLNNDGFAICDEALLQYDNFKKKEGIPDINNK